jgi:ketosteroid isomerase-like protein
VSAGQDRVARLRAAYRAFNRRDVEAVLALLDPAVEWPNLLDGTVARGHDQVRAYWRRQFETIDPRVEPVGFDAREDEVVVEVRQVVRDLDGRVLSEDRVWHAYRFRGPFVVAMRVTAA